MAIVVFYRIVKINSKTQNSIEYRKKVRPNINVGGKYFYTVPIKKMFRLNLSEPGKLRTILIEPGIPEPI